MRKKNLLVSKNMIIKTSPSSFKNKEWTHEYRTESLMNTQNEQIDRSDMDTDNRPPPPPSDFCVIEPPQCTVLMSSIATGHQEEGRPLLRGQPPLPPHRTTNQCLPLPCQTAELSSSSSLCGWEARRQILTILTLQRWGDVHVDQGGFIEFSFSQNNCIFWCWITMF